MCDYVEDDDGSKSTGIEDNVISHQCDDADKISDTENIRYDNNTGNNRKSNVV